MELKTSEEWIKEVSKFCTVVDPDGWDRSNLKYSWHEEQIKALTQELRPYTSETIYYFGIVSQGVQAANVPEETWPALNSIALYYSTNKAEVEEYADCYYRLKLYQLLGKKAEKLLPNMAKKYATDFGAYMDVELSKKHQGQIRVWPNENKCCFGGVRFAMEEDRLEALKVCGITKELQEKCSKYGLGGA